MFYYQVVTGSVTVQTGWNLLQKRTVHSFRTFPKELIEFLSFCMWRGIVTNWCIIDSNQNWWTHEPLIPFLFVNIFGANFRSAIATGIFSQREHTASIFVLMLGSVKKPMQAKLSNSQIQSGHSFGGGRQTVCFFFGGGHGCCHFILWRVIGRAIWKFF